MSVSPFVFLYCTNKTLKVKEKIFLNLPHKNFTLLIELHQEGIGVVDGDVVT